MKLGLYQDNSECLKVRNDKFLSETETLCVRKPASHCEIQVGNQKTYNSNAHGNHNVFTMIPIRVRSSVAESVIRTKEIARNAIIWLSTSSNLSANPVRE